MKTIIGNMKLREIRKNTAKLLSENGIEASAFEADVLIQTALDLDKTALIMKLEDELSEQQVREIATVTSKRLEGYPLQYIVGSWEFYGREFLVGEGVLIPRADTETLIDTAKKLVEKNSTVIDLCSGSGCIAITLEKELESNTFALEKSEKAFDFLKKNIALNDSKTTPVLCDVLNENSLKDIPQADVIVSNPPYIKTDEIRSLSKEVGFEPEMALDGDCDGLKFYREITRLWKEKIKTGGYLVYEIGYNQSEEVSDILVENGFKEVNVVYDVCKNPRVVYGKRQ